MKRIYFAKWIGIILLLNVIGINAAFASSYQWAIEEVAKHYFHTDYHDLIISVLHGGYSHSK